jgi:acyl-CoA thioester hydrolase
VTFSRIYTRTLTVPSDDIDELEHVNNVAYVRYIEDIARAHAESVGMGLAQMRETGLVPVMREHRIKYIRPAFLGDTLEVRTELVVMSGLRARRQNRVSRGELVLVESETEWVWIDLGSGRPKPIPKAALEAFGF